MDKQMEFYIYLMEKYAEYKNVSTSVILEKLDDLNLTDLIYDMYEKYHIEAIENAFEDIDELINERESN